MHPRSKYSIPELQGNLGIMKFNLVILKMKKTKPLNATISGHPAGFWEKFMLILLLKVYRKKEQTKTLLLLTFSENKK